MIDICFEEVEIPGLDPEFFALWLEKVCASHRKELGEVTLIFCSDDYLLEMNRQHLDHDYYTDIITFDYTEDNIVSGDLFISKDRLEDNADSFNTSFTNELQRVVVHGVLHLCGFGDKSEEEELKMRQLENEALELIVPRET